MWPSSDACLTIDGPGPRFASQEYAYVASCAATSNQQWKLTKVGDGVLGPIVTISLFTDPGMCLDVQWGSRVDGAPLWIWGCNGGNAQKFEIIPPTSPGDASWRLIRNVGSGLCLDKASGGNVVQWDCWSPWWQQWLLVY